MQCDNMCVMQCDNMCVKQCDNMCVMQCGNMCVMQCDIMCVRQCDQSFHLVEREVGRRAVVRRACFHDDDLSI